jgi:3-hydroxyisobutyrate dehydrogenase
MDMIAWIGTGLLGSNFVQARAERGEALQVWNRTAAKADSLRSVATVCATPKEAVQNAIRIHLTLSDDASVDEVLAAAQPVAGQLIIDHSTLDPQKTLARKQSFATKQILYVHAPVFMGPGNARDASGIILTSGARAELDAVEPVLTTMTGKLVYLGERTEAAAIYKLCGNLFLMMLTGGVAEMLRLGKSHGVSSKEISSLFDWFNPAAFAPSRATRMIAGDKKPASWELQMARKDARVMVESSGDALKLLPALIADMDRWIAQGRAASDWTIIGQDGVLE